MGIVSPDNQMFVKAAFTLDALVPGGHIGPFEGWTDGTLWNGWAMPLFERAEAARVVEQMSLLNHHGRYVPGMDAFEVESSRGGDDTAVYGRVEINTPVGPRTVYPIGCGEWIWDFAGPAN